MPEVTPNCGDGLLSSVVVAATLPLIQMMLK